MTATTFEISFLKHDDKNYFIYHLLCYNEIFCIFYRFYRINVRYVVLLFGSTLYLKAESAPLVIQSPFCWGLYILHDWASTVQWTTKRKNKQFSRTIPNTAQKKSQIWLRYPSLMHTRKKKIMFYLCTEELICDSTINFWDKKNSGQKHKKMFGGIKL